MCRMESLALLSAIDAVDVSWGDFTLSGNTQLLCVADWSEGLQRVMKAWKNNQYLVSVKFQTVSLDVEQAVPSASNEPSSLAAVAAGLHLRSLVGIASICHSYKYEE